MKKRWYLLLLRFAHAGSLVDPCQATFSGGVSFLWEVFASNSVEILSNIRLAFLGEQQGKLPY